LPIDEQNECCDRVLRRCSRRADNSSMDIASEIYRRVVVVVSRRRHHVRSRESNVAATRTSSKVRERTRFDRFCSTPLAAISCYSPSIIAPRCRLLVDVALRIDHRCSPSIRYKNGRQIKRISRLARSRDAQREHALSVRCQQLLRHTALHNRRTGNVITGGHSTDDPLSPQWSYVFPVSGCMSRLHLMASSRA